MRGTPRRGGHLRPGFTLVELLIVVLVIGILARIAVPAYQQLVYKARAAQALGDINTVRMAAYEYNADTGEWPADVYPGITPPELEPYLPTDYNFSREYYDIDWENWMLPDGTPTNNTGVLLGVSLHVEDEFLGKALEALLGSELAHYTLSTNYTFIIASSG